MINKKSKIRLNTIHLLSICIAAFCIMMLHAFLYLQNSYMSSELTAKQEELERTAQIKAESVHKKYAAMSLLLEGLANNVKDLTREDKELVVSELKLLAKVGYFSYVGISDTEGNMIDSQEQSGNIKNRDYFVGAMSGKEIISDVLVSKLIPDDEIQVIARPIINNDMTIGIVFGILNIGEIDILLENETGNHIYTQIIDSKGRYITTAKNTDSLTEHGNIWDEFKAYEFVESDINTIRDDIARQRRGNFTIQLDGEERVSFYMPLDVGNYYIFTTTSSEYIKSRTSEIGRSVILMIFEMSVATLLLFFGIYINNRSMHGQLKMSHNELVSSVEMIEIAVQESNQYIFEYDIKTKELKKKAGVENELFAKEEFQNAPESVVESGVIAETSMSDFKNMFAKIEKELTLEDVIKVKTGNAVRWFNIRMKNIYDEKGRIINTVGIVDDITEKKVWEELLEAGKQEKRELKERAERDGLTGLYNAATLKTKAAEILGAINENPGPHIFVLIDLDNFKEINDSFGHQYGDRVLEEVARVLRQTFRKDDIVARLGGDEFAVLLVNAAEYEIMTPIFRKLCDKLSKTYTKDGKSVNISASLGVAMAPEQGTTFNELYRKADLALYQVKRESKNAFKIWEQ